MNNEKIMTVPSKFGIHRKGSLICCVDARFKKDLYNATNTGNWNKDGKQPARGLT